MTIVYRYGSNLYVNLTNRCPCDCTFCYRNLSRSIGDGDDLWLDREPEPSEVIAALEGHGLDGTDEVVFCGYGEPTERLDALLAVAAELKARGKRVRLDTNGLGNLVNGCDIVPELARVLDSVSVSLNASSAEEYGPLCRPDFPPNMAYEAILGFIAECRDAGLGVTASVVGGTIPWDSEESCRRIAESMGVRFRVRG